jgi:hypothetical protein
MSRRRQIAALTVVTLAVAAVSATGAAAKTTKKAPPKIKTMRGSYSVTLVPDPTTETATVTHKVCSALDPKSVDLHPLTLPGTGTLHVVLDSPDPTGKGKTDWDLVILGASGSEYDASDGATSHEETFDPNMKKGKISIEVCNLVGQPTGNVSYTYTYR